MADRRNTGSLESRPRERPSWRDDRDSRAHLTRSRRWLNKNCQCDRNSRPAQARRPPEPPASPPGPGTDALIIFSSGTTGKSKGCVLSHGYLPSSVGNSRPWRAGRG
ncbi:hypothetical protein EJ074_01850 [Mesorhizobium sp. M3A.F.Ca.ET.080.04.2.1]|nr:hypothetical protein EJ074_01850 [Mesorhizobium sp. M3A.F.Ca.ET.080.04.2.1]